MSESPQAARPTSKRDLGADVHRDFLEERRALFRDLFDFSTGRGLEIGPLDSPIAVRPDEDVRYVDVFDRNGVQAHYAHDPNVLLELVPHIDYRLVEGDDVRTVLEAARAGAPYDWFIASHVIEHVPDVIGWLQQLARMAAPGATVLLAVPDRRRCFDVHRPPTTSGQALEAHEEGHTRPTTRAIFDFFSTVVTANPRALWRGKEPPGRDARIHALSTAMRKVEQGRAGEYVDCHVWTFTPQSLTEQIDEWRALGLCDWYLDRVVPQRRTTEFLAVLRHLPAAEQAPPPEGETSRSLAALPDFLEDEWAARRELKALREDVRDLRKHNSRLEARISELDVPVAVRMGRGARRRMNRLLGRS